MRAYDIIEKTRDGLPLTDKEINFLIDGFVNGRIPDYQVAAWAMAVFFRGMTAKEIQALTKEMINSGEKIDLQEIQGIKVDKHSTGGVGDTTTLILGPIVAAAGIPVAKMSGRGLGHTGGTIDKLEAIPGFNVQITKEQFIQQVNSLQLAVVGQTGNLVPADKKLYALRDVTATINSIPLIASSIMSKKIAAGSDAILLDVKTGSGAFLKNVAEAKQLARVMVDIGGGFKKKTMAIITNMDQPLGRAVGNSLEVKEAIETLKGEGPEDLTQLSLTLAGHMLVLAEKVNTFDEGYLQAKEILTSGKALDKFSQFIAAQGGNSKVIEDYNLLPQGAEKLEIKSAREGIVQEIDTAAIGKAAMIIGAGRAKKEDSIDLGVGIIVKKKIADQVAEEDVLAEVYYNSRDNLEEAENIIRNAYTISDKRIIEPQLILDTIF